MISIISIAASAATFGVQTHPIALDVISSTAEPRPGVPVQLAGLSDTGATIYNLTTDADGYTTYVELASTSATSITIGETSLGAGQDGGGNGSGEGSGEQVGGRQGIGVQRDWVTADSTILGGGVPGGAPTTPFVELLTISQPIAHAHHFESHAGSLARFGPGDEEFDWQEVLIVPDTDLSFRGHAGSLSTMHDIHGVLNYQGYGDSPHVYDAGFYLDSASVQLPEEGFYVAFQYFDRPCPPDTVVDLFEFRTSGGLPDDPVAAEVEAVATFPPGALVRVHGTKSAGKLILGLRSGSFGPPIVHRGVASPPTLSPVTDLGQFGSGALGQTSADAGFDCAACSPYNGQAFVDENSLTCEPEAPQVDDCPIGTLVKLDCKGRTKTFGPIQCPSAGATDVNITASIARGFSISGTFSGAPGGVGVSFGTDWVQSTTTHHTEGIPDAPEGECGPCVQLNAVASWCRGTFKYQQSQWELLPYPHVDPCAKVDYAAVPCGPQVVVKGAKCDQSKIGG